MAFSNSSGVASTKIPNSREPLETVIVAVSLLRTRPRVPSCAEKPVTVMTDGVAISSGR